jgi:hypothetical protein
MKDIVAWLDLRKICSDIYMLCRGTARVPSLFTTLTKMENSEGQVIDLYIPRKW